MINLSCRSSELFVGRGQSKAEVVSLRSSSSRSCGASDIVVAAESWRRECSKLRGMKLLCECTVMSSKVRGDHGSPVLFLLNICRYILRSLFHAACKPASCCNPFFYKSVSLNLTSLVKRLVDKLRIHHAGRFFFLLYSHLMACKTGDSSIVIHVGRAAAVYKQNIEAYRRAVKTLFPPEHIPVKQGVSR